MRESQRGGAWRTRRPIERATEGVGEQKMGMRVQVEGKDFFQRKVGWHRHGSIPKSHGGVGLGIVAVTSASGGPRKDGKRKKDTKPARLRQKGGRGEESNRHQTSEEGNFY